jgi:hypothetical protein
MVDKMIGGMTSPLPEAQGGTASPTFAGARVNMGLSTAQNSQSANYQVIAGDRGKLVRFSGAGPYTFTLIAAATLGDGWIVYARNDTAADLTIDTLGAETIDGAASITLEAGQAVLLFCNGTNFFSLGFYGVSPSGALLIVNNLSDLASVATARGNLGISSVYNPQTLAYTALAADRSKIIYYTGAGGVNLDLTAAATLGDGWYCILRNSSTGTITVEPAGAETINGAANIAVGAGQAVIINCNGTLFTTVGEYTAPISSASVLTLSTDATLPNERVFTTGSGTGLKQVDSGAGGTLTVSVNPIVNAQTLAYTATTTDRGKVIRYTGAGGLTLSLDPAATLTDGWFTVLRNDSSGTITIDPNGAETINGAANLAVTAGNSVIIYCNGTLFYTVGQASTPSSGITLGNASYMALIFGR